MLWLQAVDCLINRLPLSNWRLQCFDQNVKEPLGTRVVMNALKCVEVPINHITFMDNFFTSHSLLQELKVRRFQATGTVRENRLKRCPKEDSKELSKRNRILWLHVWWWNPHREVERQKVCLHCHKLRRNSPGSNCQPLQLEGAKEGEHTTAETNSRIQQALTFLTDLLATIAHEFMARSGTGFCWAICW